MPRSRAMAFLRYSKLFRPAKSTVTLTSRRASNRSNEPARYTYVIMKPDMSHDLVKDFTVKTVANKCTVASTSLSRAPKICPKIDLSSAACSHRITPITIANCNKGNLTMLRIGAKTSLIIRWALPAWHSSRGMAKAYDDDSQSKDWLTLLPFADGSLDKEEWPLAGPFSCRACVGLSIRGDDGLRSLCRGGGGGRPRARR